MSILILDDTASQRFLLTAILESAGYRDVAMAGSAEEAFARLGIVGAMGESAVQRNPVLDDQSWRADRRTRSLDPPCPSAGSCPPQRLHHLCVEYDGCLVRRRGRDLCSRA